MEVGELLRLLRALMQQFYRRESDMNTRHVWMQMQVAVGARASHNLAFPFSLFASRNAIFSKKF